MRILSSFCLFLCTTIVLLSPIQAIEKPETPTSNVQKGIQQVATTELESIHQAIRENNYSNAIAHLEFLTRKMKDIQARGLDKFFPVECEGFRKKNSLATNDDPNVNDNSLVLYKKTYQDSNGNTINVYVVSSDPIIRDYMTMISSQKVMKRFQNKSIIKIGNYEAIVTGAPGENYVEHNIVINSDLLVNIFYIGKIQSETISKFAAKIDLNRLEIYLKK